MSHFINERIYDHYRDLLDLGYRPGEAKAIIKAIYDYEV